MGDNEMRGFVFAVSYILFFSLFLSTIPVDFQGLGDSGTSFTPLDADLLIGFDSVQNWTKSDYMGSTYYNYELGGYYWQNAKDTNFAHYRKILFLGVWLGAVRTAYFSCANGTSRGTSISFDEIEGDAEDGFVKYSMILGNGESAGKLIFGWNITLYSDPEDAHDNDVLYILHGMGLDETQSLSIGNLLLGLMLLQVPDVPVMVSAFIIIPLGISIAYVIWFIILSMIPFLGGG